MSNGDHCVTCTLKEVRRNLAAIPVVLSGPDTAPHWACPDCGMPCYCVDPLARLSPHRPCNQREVIAA